MGKGAALIIFLILSILCIFPTVYADTFRTTASNNVMQANPTNVYGGEASVYAYSRNVMNRHWYGLYNLTNLTGTAFITQAIVQGRTWSVATDAGYSLTISYCDDTFDKMTLTWSNQGNVTDCTVAYTNTSTNFATNTIYTIQSQTLTNLISADADGLFTLKAQLLPLDHATGKQVYFSDGYLGYYMEVIVTKTSYIPMSVNHIAPLNNTWNNTDLTAYYNVSRLSNCSIYINGTLNQTQQQSANITSNFTVTMEDGSYSYYIQCSRTGYTTPDTGIYVYNKDSTQPFITYHKPLADNTTLITNGGNITINISCSDNYLYWGNYTVIKPDDTIYYNHEYNISQVNTTQYFGQNIYNITHSGAWTVNLQCWDSHTNAYFEDSKQDITDLKAKSIVYEHEHDTIRQTILTDQELTTITKSKEIDRISTEYTFTKPLAKDEVIQIEIKFNNIKLHLVVNSDYPGHLVAFPYYWHDAVMDGFTHTKTIKVDDYTYIYEYKANAQVKETVLQSFGYLNYNSESAIFTVLAAPNGTTTGTFDLNQSVNCSATYTNYSFAQYLQLQLCENYIYYGHDNKVSMGYIALALVLISTIFLLYKISESIEYKFFDVNIAKHLVMLAGMWLLVPLLNVGIAITQSDPTSYPVENTLAGVYKAVIWILVTITTFYFVGILYYAYKMFAEAGTK